MAYSGRRRNRLRGQVLDDDAFGGIPPSWIVKNETDDDSEDDESVGRDSPCSSASSSDTEEECVRGRGGWGPGILPVMREGEREEQAPQKREVLMLSELVRHLESHLREGDAIITVETSGREVPDLVSTYCHGVAWERGRPKVGAYNAGDRALHLHFI